MESLEKIGLCYELGFKGDPEANMARGLGATRRFLEAMKLVEDQSSPPLYTQPRYIEVERAVKRRTNDFTFVGKFKTFGPLAEGEQIATDGQTTYVAERGQVIIFPNADAQIGEEAFSVGREFEYQVAS